LQLAKTEFEEAKKNLVIQQDIIIRDLDKQAEDLKKAAQILNEDLDTTGTYARKRLDIRRNLNDLLETINNTQFDSDPTKNAEMQSQANEKALQRALRQTQELDKEIKDNLLNRNPLLEMEIQRLQRGNADPFVVNRMQRDLATSKWQEEYSTRRDDINEDQGLSPEEKTQAISILDGINAAKLREIADSFKTFGQALADSAISTGLQSLKDGLADLITNDLIIGFDGATGKTRDLSNELRGFERVIYNVSKAVLNAMTKILVDAAVNKLFGKDGLLDIGKIFGAAKGGIVPNYAEGGSVGEIGKAMQRERSQNGGKQPVLAVLTPGERVLTVSQNKRFEALQLERFLQPSAVMPEEIAYRKINNYAFGGVVGMNPVPMGSYAQGQSDNSTTINIPVTVENNGNSNDSQLDANSLQNVVRSAVLTEIQRQQRQGGILRR